MTLLLALLLTPSRADDCPVGDPHARSNDELAAALESAEALFVANPDRFGKTVAGPVRVTAGCLAEPIVPEVAARYHRLYALRSDPFGKFGLESTAVAESFRAARFIEPTYSFPAELLSESHGLRTAYDGMPADAPVTDRVPAPRAGQLWFDGVQGNARPVNAATFFQLTSEDGAVVSSAYVPGGGALPEYPRDPVLRRGLAGVAIGTSAAAVGLYAGALVTEARLKKPTATWTRPQLDAMTSANHGLLIGSVSAAAVGLGFGVGALLVGQR